MWRRKPRAGGASLLLGEVLALIDALEVLTMDESTANTFVSPFGTQHTVQHGVDVVKPKSLRSLFVAAADDSQMELNPEQFQGLRAMVTHARR